MSRNQLIQTRRGTAAAWASANPVLAAGEPGFETDTGVTKIGDGTTAYTSLNPILSGTYGQVWATPAASTTLTGTLAAWTVTSVDCTAGAGARTLPAANSVTAGTAVCAKKGDTSTNALVVSRAGSDLIFGTGSGATTKTLSLAGEAVTFVSNGVSRWTVRDSDTPGSVLATTYGPQVGSDNWLKAWSTAPDALFVGAVTVDGNGAPTSAPVVWPDGTTGTYTGTASGSFLGSIDSYTVTYVGSTTKTVTQSAVTRNGSGYVTNRPVRTVA